MPVRFRRAILTFSILLLLAAGLHLVFRPPDLAVPPPGTQSEADRRIEAVCSIRTLELQPAYDGPAVATLISAPPPAAPRGTVLYVHGYGDYFFQYHLMQWFRQQGFAFHALELRRYGRSWLSHQRPNDVRDLEAYFEEINLALAELDPVSPGPVFLMGHSTGGLTCALYAHRGAERDRVDGLILNSPFLDFNAGPGTERAIDLFGLLAGLYPQAAVPGRDSSRYTQSLHADYAGRWRFHTGWKPLHSFPLFVSWLRAVDRGHEAVARGLDLSMPVLMLHADRTLAADLPPEELSRGDAVLDVADMRRLAPRLGSRVKRVEVEGAVHDVFLSRPDALHAAFRATQEWLDRQVAPTD